MFAPAAGSRVPSNRGGRIMDHPAVGEEGQRPDPIMVHGLSLLCAGQAPPKPCGPSKGCLWAETPKFDLDIYIANYSGERVRPSTRSSVRADRPRQGGQDSVVSTSLGNAHQPSVSKPSKLLQQRPGREATSRAMKTPSSFSDAHSRAWRSKSRRTRSGWKGRISKTRLKRLAWSTS
jgi:hypothetical protein